MWYLAASRSIGKLRHFEKMYYWKWPYLISIFYSSFCYKFSSQTQNNRIHSFDNNTGEINIHVLFNSLKRLETTKYMKQRSALSKAGLNKIYQSLLSLENFCLHTGSAHSNTGSNLEMSIDNTKMGAGDSYTEACWKASFFFGYFQQVSSKAGQVVIIKPRVSKDTTSRNYLKLFWDRDNTVHGHQTLSVYRKYSRY